MNNNEYSFLKFRMFGSADCDKCKSMQKIMEHHQLVYDFIDANDDKNDKLCDLFNIDELPVIQILDTSRRNLVIAFKIGLVDPMKMLKEAAELWKYQKHGSHGSFNLSKKKRSRGCSSCGE